MEKSYAQHYALLEAEHWWFRARRMILRNLLCQLVWPPQPRILEIGVGPGHNLLEIYPADSRIEGVEPDEVLAGIAAARVPGPVFNASIDQLPPEIRDGSYDGVALFDVLEHIEDDARALQIVYRKLRPGGRIVVSAPAYMWLWGQQDVVNQHYRRYTSLELRRKLQASDFVIERVTYFNTILFAFSRAAAVSRTKKREILLMSASRQMQSCLARLPQNGSSCDTSTFHLAFRSSLRRENPSQAPNPRTKRSFSGGLNSSSAAERLITQQSPLSVWTGLSARKKKSGKKEIKELLSLRLGSTDSHTIDHIGFLSQQEVIMSKRISGSSCKSASIIPTQSPDAKDKPAETAL